MAASMASMTAGSGTSSTMMPPDDDPPIMPRTVVRPVRRRTRTICLLRWITAAAVICLLLMGCAGTAAQPTRCITSYKNATSETPIVIEYIGASDADCKDVSGGTLRLASPPPGKPACVWQEPSGIVTVVYGTAAAEAYCAAGGH